ncbi:sulfite exporter TauE/SafE family protein [Shewanella sp. UCD-KL12]|uniref:sulfite exporter TauE/SafE family protein n=1 Tax=Shewanella sp. UCD-KL12 TaxID=1917163 RepID=UPI000970FC98|nr:sulfite exporter TauE/SafE family protein [Shewanella sp. UCD-KL12]
MSEHGKNSKAFNSKPLYLFLGLASLWSIWVLQFSDPIELIRDYLHYLFLGITGAIFANSTGAGGGVIFIPVFNSLNFTSEQSISTSFAIQCFGMTAGALTWWFHFNRDNLSPVRKALIKQLSVTSPFAVAGIWTAQLLSFQPPSSLEFSFSIFSIVLGVAILYSCLTLKQTNLRTSLNRSELIQLSCISFIGGIITAWLSVGVGEIIVIYMLLKRCEPSLAIALGVIVTAITVWSVSPIHLSKHGDAYFNVLLFAGPGAVIGGVLAKKLALYLPVKGLKVFFAGWIILSGIAILVI